jgi:hypothetical protein
MNRILVSAIIAFVCWQCSSPRSAEGETTYQPSEQTADNRKNPCIPLPLVANKGSAENQNPCETEPSENHKRLVEITPSPLLIKTEESAWEKALVLSTCGLMLVGIGQIIFLGLTVSATKDNAKAARMGAEAVINSERAWLLWEKIDAAFMAPFEDQQTRATTVFAGFKNFGKTVAKMTAWKFGLYITAINEEPDPIAYDVSGTNFNLTVIPQGDILPQIAQLTGPHAIIRKQEIDDATINGTKILWLCGIIKYEDVLLPGIKHTTLVCRRYSMLIPGQPPDFYLEGTPDKYNYAD